MDREHHQLGGGGNTFDCEMRIDKERQTVKNLIPKNV